MPPTNYAEKYQSTQDLARLPRAEQQRRLGGQTNDQPFGVDHGRAIAPTQRTLSSQEIASRGGTPSGVPAGVSQGPPGRRQPIHPGVQQRTLSAEEKAARQAAFQRAASQQGPTPPFEQIMSQDDPAWTPQHVGQGMRQADGGPHEGFERRMQRVSQAVSPQMIDRDRDGIPDAGSNQSARTQRDFHARFDRDVREVAALPQQVDRNRDGYPDNTTPGPDGHRQDQVGYRARLRGYKAMAQAHEEQFQSLEQEEPSPEEPETPEEPAETPPAPPGPTQEQLKAQAAVMAKPEARRAFRQAPRMDAKEPPQQVTRNREGQVATISDPQGHEPPADTPNSPRPDVQVSLPEGQPNPVSPAEHGGPAEPPIAHAATPVPEEAKTSPSATSPPAPPAQQEIRGQQHPTAQQAPAHQPRSRFTPGSPSQPPENAPRPADTGVEKPQE
jgi:hypothetical protein